FEPERMEGDFDRLELVAEGGVEDEPACRSLHRDERVVDDRVVMEDVHRRAEELVGRRLVEEGPARGAAEHRQQVVQVQAEWGMAVCGWVTEARDVLVLEE